MLMLAGPAAAQTISVEPLGEPLPPEPPAAAPTRAPITSQPAEAALLRGLDKMTGRITDIELKVGERRSYERLELTLGTCRLPGPGGPKDAFAWLEIRDRRQAEPAFRGWMFAASPALSALDHPRYDVWVISCKTSSAEQSTDKAQN
ncbi:MAG TPA: DUF2155 domain-containing protein [Paracoccaceae bacterium]|nr:DUF2155 domain-containing protein [Paracoccaceae bacterium]